MKKMMKCLIALLAVTALLACSEDAKEIESVAQLNAPQYTIGYEEGQSSATMLLKTHPNAVLKSFTDKIVGYEALKQGKIDAFAFERLQLQIAIDSGLSGVRLLDEPLGDTINVAIGISRVSKIPDLENRINEFLDSIQANGTLEKMRNHWFEQGNETMPEIAKPENPTLHIKIGTTGLVQPYSYYKDNALNGFDIELSKRLALWLNADFEFGIYDYNSIVAAAASGDIDCIVANLNETAERKERINFSKPISQIVNAIMIKDDGSRMSQTGNVNRDSLLKDVPPQFRDWKLKYNSIADMNRQDNLVLGMQVGFVFVDKETRRILPKAKIDYYKSTPDMAYLVANGKLDGFINDEPVIRYVALENPNLAYIHAGFEPMDIVVMCPKTNAGEKLRDELNLFIERLRNNGTLKAIDDLWLGHDEARKVVEFPVAKPGKPTLKMGTSAITAPFEYIKDGKVVGYEIDLMARFCAENGYGLEIHDVPFESLVLGVETGMYDFAASALSATPAFKEKFNLSNAIYVSECVMAVQVLDKANSTTADSESSDVGWFESLKLSFERTFIRESRWKLVLHGVGVTIFLSILSGLLGTLIGFAFCMLRLSGNKLANIFALGYIRLLQGIPSVVLLMVLFYIVFARTGLDGVWVAIIGFGMNFGAYVAEIMRTGILAVDKGQMEAALALGYTRSRAFFKIVFPQAARHFLPVFQGEFISMVKMTSVVGYIAILDLTKASDIIRSRTYEAFFPLIMTAVIYLIIVWVLTRVLILLQRRLNPLNRKAKI